MRAVVQRVLQAQVMVEGRVVGQIGPGLVAFLGFSTRDSTQDLAYMAEKIANLRIFEDQDRKMNCSALDLNLSILAVSQFTLYGDVRKGRRPSWNEAAGADAALGLYEQAVELLRATTLTVETGIFQADMKVEVVNDGPVTILLDSEKLF